MKQFHERIRARMVELGLNQTDLAKIVGVKQSSIWSLLQGDIEKPRFILELAKALQTSTQWLLTGREDGEMPLQDISSTRALLSELAGVAIDSVRNPKQSDDLAKTAQEKILSYFWADVEKGKPPTYDQVLRLAQTLIGKK